MTPRDRRAIVLGTVLVGGLVLSLRGVPTVVRAVERLRAHAIESDATASRARSLVSGASAVRDSLTQVLGAVVALAPRLVGGHSAAEAQATLAGLLNLAASRNALKVLSLDPLPDSAAAVFTQVHVHAMLEGDIRGIAGFLRTIETGDPILTAPALAVSAPDPGAPRGPETLHVDLLVSGYYLPRGQE